MPVRARQGPKLVVCAKTHDSGQQFPVEIFARMQDYWVKALSAGGGGPLGSHLPRLGVELNAIPAMSAEAERVFSGYVLSVAFFKLCYVN
jgi:hypothetical protein